MTKGLGSIYQYYVDPVHIQALSVAGLRAVAAQDKSLTLFPSQKYLNVFQDREIVSQVPWPHSDYPANWALFSIAVLSDLRSISDEIVQLNQDEILHSYFMGVSSRLDRFTRYSSPEQAALQRGDREGFGGVGLSLEQGDNDFRITAIAADSPAARSNISIGDSLTAIDGRDIRDWTLDDVLRALHGRVGTTVRLATTSAETLIPREQILRRREIIPNTVSFRQLKHFPTIRLSRFNKKTSERVADMVERLKENSGAEIAGLVIDLRGNPGGLLDEAVETADLFLDSGVIASTTGRHPQSDQQFNATSGDMLDGLPIVVLIDGGTASAAEILAAALQDHRRAVVVGSVSYGKGTVQKIVHMPNNGELALTWARYLTPSEYAIHDFGVLPNICTIHYENGVAAVLKTLRKSPWQANMRFRYLRSLQYLGPDQVKEFRASCPWNGRTPQQIDIDAADALLSDSGLYEDALNLGNRVYAVR